VNILRVYCVCSGAGEQERRPWLGGGGFIPALLGPHGRAELFGIAVIKTSDTNNTIDRGPGISEPSVRGSTTPIRGWEVSLHIRQV
jgi:hypothetical protein